jgi:hypothetical protein
MKEFLMKNIIVTFAVCFTQILAYAHPTDINTAQSIPLKSTLTVLEDINLLPNSDELYFNQQGPESVGDAYERLWGGGVMCGLDFNSRTEDRVIRKGTKYQITNIDLHQGSNAFHAQINSQNISYIDCVVLSDKKLNIGELRNALQKYFRLDVAPPVEVR